LRWSLLILLLLAGTAFAKPKIAIAPIDGDKNDEVGEIIVSVAASPGRAIDPGRVGREMEKLSISKMSTKSAKKLREKLGADVVVYGKLSKKHLELRVAGKGKAKVEIDFKSNKDLKKQLQSKLGKELDAALEGPDSDEDDEDSASPFGGGNKDRDGDKDRDDEDRRKRDEDDKRKRDEDEQRKRDEDDKREKEERRARDEKRQREEDDKRTSKRDRDDDKRGSKRDRDDDKRTSKRDRDDDKRAAKRDRDDEDGGKRTARRDDDEDRDDEERDDEDRPRKKRKKQKRHPLTQAAVWLDAGPAFARRTLTYQGGGMTPPPRVGTIAAAGEVEGELYPGSFSTLKGAAANIGIAAAYDRAFGLGIAVPKTTVTTPIAQGFYWIGARYRFVFGTSSVAVGASYWRRYYTADRSKLMMADQLDMPDVDYKAIAPDVTARIAAAPNVSVFAALQIPLMLTSGPIQEPMSYGPSTILAFDVRGGVQLALGSHYAVQMGLYFDQIGFKFVAKQGSLAAAREVTAATDRSFGLAATLGVFY
jgi:hypothetical protein